MIQIIAPRASLAVAFSLSLIAFERYYHKMRSCHIYHSRNGSEVKYCPVLDSFDGGEVA